MIYFTAHTFKCVCHCRRAMFRVLGMYNFDISFKRSRKFEKKIMVSLILPKTQRKDSLLSRKMLNQKISIIMCRYFFYLDARVEIREHFSLGLGEN